MQKFARKPSSDPVQEKLRAAKATWNAEVSAFIGNLIHAKKLLNGAPNKFNKMKSPITFPIPADPATIIGSLANDFQEIANKSRDIIQEQLDYSKNRRQKQPKLAPTSPGNLQAIEPAQTPPADLSKQLAAWEIKYEQQLYAEGSNPYTRFITRILNPRIGFGEGARIKRLRMTMLDSCVKAYKELKKLHKEIVKSSSGSIVNSYKMMTAVWNHWNAVNRLFSTFKALRPKTIQDTGEKIILPDDIKEEQKQEIVPPISDDKLQQADAVVKDIQTNGNNFPNIATLTQFASEFARASKELKSKYVDALLNGYQQVLTQLCQQKKIPLQNSLADILAMDTKSPATKEAQLGRWMGKARHQIIPGATSGTRLEIYRLIEDIKKDLNNVMNLLEKGLDEGALTISIKQVNAEISTLKSLLRSLYFAEQPDKSSPEGGMMDFMGL